MREREGERERARARVRERGGPEHHPRTTHASSAFVPAQLASLSNINVVKGVGVKLGVWGLELVVWSLVFFG